MKMWKPGTFRPDLLRCVVYPPPTVESWNRAVDRLAVSIRLAVQRSFAAPWIATLPSRINPRS